MTSVLTSLASRKLEAARKAALLHLQERRETIELIRRAEDVADYQLPWDWQQIKSEDVPASDVNAADYLAVLSISGKAVASNRQLLVDAKELMGELEKERSSAVEKLRTAVMDLEKELENLKNAANNKLRESQAKASGLVLNRQLPTQPDMPSGAGKGCGVAVLVYLGGFSMVGSMVRALGLKPTDSLANLIAAVVVVLWIAACLWFSFFGIPLLERHGWKQKCASIDLKATEEAQELLHEAQTEYANNLAVIERHIPNQLKASATELTGAEALFNKAREASAMVLVHDAKYPS